MENRLVKTIKQLRISKELSQKDLAAMLEISPSYYSEIENGNKTLTISLIYKISDILKISLWKLLRESECINSIGSIVCRIEKLSPDSLLEISEYLNYLEYREGQCQK